MMTWYYGHLKSEPNVLEVFPSKKKPTERSHGHRYHAVTGPYPSASHAIHEAQEHRRHTNVDYGIVLHPVVPGHHGYDPSAKLNPEYRVYGGRQKNAEFRAMTLEEAKMLSSGDHIWFVSNDGSARQVKVNGAVKRWKRDQNRIEVPVKYGMYEYATFTERDVANGRLLVSV